MHDINEDLSLLDAGLLLKLSLNLQLGCGSFPVSGREADGSPKPLKKAEIGKILGKKSRNGIDAALKRLLELGVLLKDGRRYHINERLIAIEKDAGKAPFTKLYCTQTKELLDKLTDTEAGLILKATAYVSHQF